MFITGAVACLASVVREAMKATATCGHKLMVVPLCRVCVPRSTVGRDGLSDAGIEGVDRASVSDLTSIRGWLGPKVRQGQSAKCRQSSSTFDARRVLSSCRHRSAAPFSFSQHMTPPLGIASDTDGRSHPMPWQRWRRAFRDARVERDAAGRNYRVLRKL